MTEFEKVLSEMLDEYGSDPDRMKDCVIEKYGKAIRKSIVSEVDVDNMKDRFINNLPAYTLVHPDIDYRLWGEPYKKGIGDTLKAIGGE